MSIGIIGAGASGIIAALSIDLNQKVTILENNNKVGKKLLVTGNGKCNYWNDNINFNKYNTDNLKKLEEILNETNIKNTYNFLEKLGLYPKIKDELYYPQSESAQSVRTILEKNIENHKNINVIYEYNVNKIEFINNKFIINNELEFDKLIIATGGKASPKTGSNGNLYQEFVKLGHQVNKVLPSLTKLKYAQKYDWDGIRTDAKVCLLKNNELIDTETGEIQLKESSISGICIFNLSGKVSKYLNTNDEVILSIDFLPNIYDLKNFIINRNNLLNNPSIEFLFESIFNYKLMFVILDKAKIDKNKSWNNLTAEEQDLLIKTIKRFKIKIIETGDFENSQVSTGGISLSNINSKNMESNIINNLYFIGEVLDVDGKCGGYNLAFAFISGYIVGKNI